MNQLKVQTEERKKEVEDLKAVLKAKKLESAEKDKQMEELQATLDGKKRELEETNSELCELNQLLEEESKEADESMNKYCSLMVEVHKLEETNEALTTRLEQITADTTLTWVSHSCCFRLTWRVEQPWDSSRFLSTSYLASR